MAKINFHLLGTYRGFEVYETKVRGKFVFIVGLGERFYSAAHVEPLRNLIDDYLRTKLN